ncbi:MAG TPA: hypothetical protein VLT13_15535 [Bacteroidota bacterium]|nr:hypothetical protein [Bacteroidota bacterium]
MNRHVFIVFVLLAVTALPGILPSSAMAQAKYLSTYALNAQSGEILVTIPSNSISHISVGGSVLWIGTGKGLAKSTNGGRTWESFMTTPQFASRGIFGIALRGDTIWASTGYSKDVDGSSVQTGSG